MNRNLKLIFIIAIILILGSFRAVLFESLNNQYSFLNGEIPKNGLVSYMSFIENYSMSTLVKLKWIFTITYTLIFLFLGRYVLKTLFNSADFALWYSIVYGLIFVLSGLLFCIGHFTGLTENLYSLARTLMGALQSPIPLLIICPLLFLKKHL